MRDRRDRYPHGLLFCKKNYPIKESPNQHKLLFFRDLYKTGLRVFPRFIKFPFLLLTSESIYSIIYGVRNKVI